MEQCCNQHTALNEDIEKVRELGEKISEHLKNNKALEVRI